MDKTKSTDDAANTSEPGAAKAARTQRLANAIEALDEEMDALRTTTDEIERIIATHRADDEPELRAAIVTLADSMAKQHGRMALHAQMYRSDLDRLESKKDREVANRFSMQLTVATWVLALATLGLIVATLAARH